MSDFAIFKRACLDVLSKSGNCEESQKAFSEAHSYHDMVLVWKKYIDGMMKEVPVYVKNTFSELYDLYKSEMNLSGVFFNECPLNDSLSSIVIVGDGDPFSLFLSIRGRHHVYVIGNYPVSIHGECMVFVNDRHSIVSIYDSSFANVRCGNLFLYDHSSATGRGSFTTFNSSSIDAYGSSKVYDYSHSMIRAYGDTVVFSKSDRKIQLFDNSSIKDKSITDDFTA